MPIDLSYARAAKLLKGDEKSDIELHLVGCGGTGSWLAPAVVRVASVLAEKEVTVKVHFWDPDTVERKNLVRQNFCEAEIGENKAVTLARRFSQAWGLTIRSHAAKFSDDYRPETARGILLGAVDNAAGRKTIAEFLSHRQPNQPRRPAPWWWIDSGNGESSGQILMGSTTEKKRLKGSFIGPKVCAQLPAPSLTEPNLLKANREETNTTGLSCAELAMLNAQAMDINQRMAAEAASYLVEFLFGNLKTLATYINLRSRVTTSYYLTPDAVASAVNLKPEALLTLPTKK